MINQYEYNDGGTYRFETLIDENGICVNHSYGEAIYFFIKNEDGTFDNYEYMKDESYKYGGQWVKRYDNSSMDYDMAVQDIPIIDLGDNFDVFTYDEEKGAYVNTEDVTIVLYYLVEGEKYGIDICVSSVEINIVNGAVAKICCEYTVPEDPEETKYSLTCFNFGTTKVILPEGVRENAIQLPEPVYN